MINGNLSQFLDTGWYSEGTIYFSGYIYWCEGDTNPETGISHFWVNRWRAETEENKLYRSIIDNNGDPHGYATVLDMYDSSMDRLNKRFLEASIFDGKTFWQVENKIAWLEEGSPIIENGRENP